MKGRFDIGQLLLNMLLSRLFLFRRGLTTAVLRDFGKGGEVRVYHPQIC